MSGECVLAFAGHMIDEPGRSPPRFPPELEPAVREAIHQYFEQISPVAVVCSAACGGDILCAEEALSRDIPVYIILPFEDRDEFIIHSIVRGGPGWIERFERVCDRAKAMPFFSKAGSYESSEDFERAQHAVIFFALGFAAAKNVKLQALIVFDQNQDEAKTGGTNSFLKLCNMLKLQHEIVELGQLRLRPFDISFPNSHIARAIRVPDFDSLPNALAELGLQQPQPVLVLVGGADGLSGVDLNRIKPFFAEVLAPLAEELNAIILDGGTDSGVMHLIGQTRAESNSKFQLFGLAVEKLTTWPGNTQQTGRSLEPNHTYFVLVEGGGWGDESPWISDLATTLSRKAKSVTIFVNGGEIAWQDVWQSVTVHRPVIVVAGSGRAADELATAVRRGSYDLQIKTLISSGLVSVVELSQSPEQTIGLIKSILLNEE